MNENLMKLIENLTKAGFIIDEIEVKTVDIARIKFKKESNLEVLIANTSAEIMAKGISSKQLNALKAIIQKFYTINNGINANEEDMFFKLQYAS